MTGGYGAPFFKVYYKDKELKYPFKKLNYVYDEEGDDVCTIDVQTRDVAIADEPAFQENAEIKVTWGYINGPTITRKVYMDDISWTFDKDGVTGKLKGSEKAVSLRQNSSNKIHSNTLPGMVSDIAKNHGVQANIEIGNQKPQPKGKNGKYASLKDFQDFDDGQKEKEKVVIAERNIDRQRSENDKAVLQSYEYFRFEQQLNAYKEKRQIPPPEFLQRNAPYLRVYQSRFPKLNLPQGGKSDMQVLKDAAELSSKEPIVIDTRDDEITVKKRNYNQKPLRTYTYAGGDGNLLSFTPETKAKQNKGNTLNVQYGDWDSETKVWNAGVANSDSSGDKTTLADYIPKGQIGFTKDFGLLQGAAPADQVNVRKGIVFKELTDDVLKKQVMGPRGNENSVNNRRDLGDLQKNPATGLIIGDPKIEVGVILTFSGVSKKHSGNYYLVKSTHDLDPSSAYMTTLELARQGSNIKSNDQTQSAKESRKLVNKQMGVDKETRTRKLLQKINKR